MSEAQPEQPQILDEAAFCRQLGLDPDHVQSGSITVNFTPQGAVVGWASRVIVPPQVVGLAFMAGAGMAIQQDDSESEEPKRAGKKSAEKR